MNKAKNKGEILSGLAIVSLILLSIFSIGSATLLPKTRQTTNSKAAETCNPDKCDNGGGGCSDPNTVSGSYTCCAKNTGPRQLPYAYWSNIGCADLPPTNPPAPTVSVPIGCTGTCSQGEQPDQGQNSLSCVKESNVNTGYYCTCDRKNASKLNYPAYDPQRFDVCPKPTPLPIGITQAADSCGSIKVNTCADNYCCGDCRITHPGADYNCLIPEPTYRAAMNSLTPAPTITPTATPIPTTPPSTIPTIPVVKCGNANGPQIINNNCYQCNYSYQENPTLIGVGICPVPTTPTTKCLYQNLTDCRDECQDSCTRNGCENGPGSYQCVIVPTIIPTTEPLPTTDPDPSCKKNQKCSGPGAINCCSNEACIQTPYGYYCGQVTDKTCNNTPIRCNGYYLEKCENGIFVNQRRCDGGCSEQSGAPVCNMFAVNDAASSGTSGQCQKENDCCGIGICVKKGWFTNELICQTCPGSEECSTETRKCSEPELPLSSPSGNPIIRNNRCYAFFNPTGQNGEWIVVGQNICDEYYNGTRTKIGSGEIVTAALSSEDQYRLRQAAYKAYQNNPDVSTGDKIAAGAMSVGDAIGNAWGWFGSGFSKTLAGATNSTIGNATAEATSSLGNYYVTASQTDFSNGGPTVLEALGTGIVGGGKYAYDMTLGAINGLTMGKITPLANLNTAVEDLNKQALTNIYQGDEGKVNFAQSAMRAGNDLTNTVAIFVPVGKAAQGVGNSLTSAGNKLAATGGKLAEVSGGAVSLTGKVFSTAGKVVEAVSPESWAAGFIKNAPITTAIEAGVTKTAKVVSSAPIVLKASASLSVARVALTANPVIMPVANVVSFAGKATAKVAEGAFNLFVPRSALTYTQAEAANLIARDIRLGLTDGADVLTRLSNKYHVQLNSVAEVEAFLKQTPLETGVADEILTAVNATHPEVQFTNNPELLNAQAKLQEARKLAEEANQKVADKKYGFLGLNKNNALKEATNADAAVQKLEAEVNQLTQNLKQTPFAVKPVEFLDNPTAYLKNKYDEFLVKQKQAQAAREAQSLAEKQAQAAKLAADANLPKTEPVIDVNAPATAPHAANPENIFQQAKTKWDDFWAKRKETQVLKDQAAKDQAAIEAQAAAVEKQAADDLAQAQAKARAEAAKSPQPVKTYKVGRKNLKDLDNEVSREHLEVGVDSSGNLSIKDLGSTNGTYIWNGKSWIPVKGVQSVVDGQYINLGTSTGSQFMVVKTQGNSIYLVNTQTLKTYLVKGPDGILGYLTDSTLGGSMRKLAQARAEIVNDIPRSNANIVVKGSNTPNIKKAANAEIGKLSPRSLNDFKASDGSWRLAEKYQPKNVRSDLIIDFKKEFPKGGVQTDIVYNYVITDNGGFFAAPQKLASVVGEQGVKHFQVAYEAIYNRHQGSGVVRSGELIVQKDGTVLVNLSSGTFSDYGKGIWGQRWAENQANIDQLATIIQGSLGISDRSKIKFLGK